MTLYTPRFKLYKPGGGSSGANTPDEVVDIDRLNGNFDAIDAALGIPIVTRASLLAPAQSQAIKDPTDGELYSWYNGQWISTLPSRLVASNLAAAFVSKTDPSSLDTRYFTQAKLLAGGVLDTVYAKKGDGSGLHIQGIWSNTYSLDARNNNRAHVTANFPSGRFTAAPQVIITPISTTPDNCAVGANPVTKDSAEIYLNRSDSPSGTTTVMVIALQTN